MNQKNPLTVSDLLALLRKLPPDAPIMIPSADEEGLFFARVAFPAEVVEGGPDQTLVGSWKEDETGFQLVKLRDRGSYCAKRDPIGPPFLAVILSGYLPNCYRDEGV